MSKIKNSIIARILIYQLIAYLTCICPINALAQEKGTKKVQEYIAILDLQTKKGVPEEVKSPLTEKLQTEIINSRKYKVVDRAHRDKILEEQGFQLKDCVRSECVVEAGQLLGVGKIVTGSISKLGETYYINTQLINVETGVVEAASYEACEECTLDELVYPAAIAGKKLMGLPYTPYRPKKGVMRVPGKEIITSPIIEMERIEEFEKRYQKIQDFLWASATLENYYKARQLSDELKNDLIYESSYKALALYKEIKKINKLIENEIKRIKSIRKLRLTGKIAFQRVGDIYVMNADGSGHRLTYNSKYDGEPAWSPDGKKIAFVSDKHGNRQIYVMNADRTAQTRLTNNSVGDAFPAWSPDGSKIAFVSERDENHEIYVMNEDGSYQINLNNNPALDKYPVWSPDGKKIAFYSNRDKNHGIYVMNADGSNQTKLTYDGTVFDYKLDWSP